VATHAPVAVVLIALLDVLVFVYLASLESSQATSFVDRYGLVPRELLRALSDPGSGAPLWISPLTSMFLHGDVWHLAGNLLYLWIFGALLEERLGHARFVAFYLACGLAAALLHVASAPGAYLPALGSSGAISGLLGAYAASGPRARLRLRWPPIAVPALALLGIWIALQLASAVDLRGEGSGAVAGWAHLGGFASGALGMRWLARRALPAHAGLRS
jgi:membrane associated rhomboid family serine protease